MPMNLLSRLLGCVLTPPVPEPAEPVPVPVDPQREQTPLFPARGPDGTWGYIDPSGSFVIEPRYLRAHPFSEGLAFVELDNFSVLCIDKGDQHLFRLQDWRSAEGTELGRTDGFHDGRARLVPRHSARQYAFVGRTGELLPQRFEKARPFSAGVAAVRHQGQWAWLRPDGQLTLLPEVLELGDLGPDGLAVARMRRQVEGGGVLTEDGYVDVDGKVVIEPRFVQAHAFSEGLAAVKLSHEAQSWGYIDREGTQVIEPSWTSAGPFQDGRAGVVARRGGATVYIDRQGKEVFTMSPGAMGLLSEGLAIAAFSGGPYGYSDRNGVMVIPPAFTQAGPFQEGLARVLVRDAARHVREGYIDRGGAWVYAWEYDEPPPPELGPHRDLERPPG
jgi:hypothetical protein